MKRILLKSLVVSSLLTGCASTSLPPTGQGPGVGIGFDLPENWQSAEASAQPANAPRNDELWLEAFEDGIWTELVRLAYRNNPDLEVLRANLDRAEALADRARSGLLPTLNGLLDGSRSDALQGDDASSASLGAQLSASWEPDLWGRLEASVRSDDLDRAAVRADLEAARQLLATSVVQAAFLAIEAHRLAEVSDQNLKALSETLGFVEVQYDRGLRSAQDLALIRADVASATSSLRQAEGSARQARRALEILVGAYPDIERELTLDLPEVPAVAFIGQPADMLRARPDLRAAEIRVDAAYTQHEAALAAVKPRLTLNGSFGGSDAQLGQILEPTSLAATLFANVAAPLYDGGQRKADIAIARADIDAALAVYRRSALDAFQEVEDQLDQEKILRDREMDLLSALQDARDALRFTQFRYESAEADLLNVLQVQQRVSFIEGQLVSVRRARLVQYLNLTLALGLAEDI